MKFAIYLLKKFIVYFIGATFFFSFVLIMVDLGMNLWSYVSNQVPPKDILYVLFLYIPKTLSFSLPLAILFAVSYTLSDLYAKNELTAVFASGVSLLRFTLPLLVFSLLLSFLLFFFEDKVVVPSYAKKNELQNQLLNKEESLNNNRLVIIASGGDIVYKADTYNDKAQKLNNIYIILRNKDRSLNAIVRSNSAVWNGTSWDLSGAIQYTLKGEMFFAGNVEENIQSLLIEPPETFRNNTVSVDTVNIEEAKTYIARLRRAGLSTDEALSQYYEKFSFPFIVFIVVFLSIGLSGKTRKNVLLISLALCIAAAVLYYVTQMVTMLLAQWGYISPLAGAWFPVILFITISIVLLKFART